VRHTVVEPKSERRLVGLHRHWLANENKKFKALLTPTAMPSQPLKKAPFGNRI
jgi:hypothetical protein